MVRTLSALLEIPLDNLGQPPALAGQARRDRPAAARVRPQSIGAKFAE